MVLPRVVGRGGGGGGRGGGGGEGGGWGLGCKLKELADLVRDLSESWEQGFTSRDELFELISGGETSESISSATSRFDKVSNLFVSLMFLLKLLKLVGLASFRFLL